MSYFIYKCGTSRLPVRCGRFSPSTVLPPVIPSGARVFRERSRGIYAERFFFRALSGTSLRGDPSARSLGLRLAHLVEMTIKDAARMMFNSVLRNWGIDTRATSQS
jgi:hypothetical protein